MNKKLCIMIFALLLVACSQGGDNVVRQSSRDNVVDISGDLKTISVPDSVLISNSNEIFIIDKYLAVTDGNSRDRLVHFFDAQSLQFVNSAIWWGDGPSEINVIGTLAYLKPDNSVLVWNNGKYQIYKFSLESLLHDSDWTAEEEIPMSRSSFPIELVMISDTEAMVTLIKPSSPTKYNMVLARYNIITGESQEYGYAPDKERQRITIDASADKNLCAVAYRRKDLLILTDLEGNKLKEVRGPMWGQENRMDLETFGYVVITKNHIVASYVGNGGANEPGNWPEKLEVFSLDGEYERTLNVGHPIRRMCYDDVTGRIFLSLDDDPQFVYYDFDE